MKVTICNTRAGNPSVHKAGCRDIKRGLATRKYSDPWDLDVLSETDATLAYWDNGILEESYGYEGAQYDDRETATEAFRVSYMRFAPCVRDLPDRDPADEKIVEFPSGNPSETASDEVDSSQEENTKEGEKMTETQTPETTSPTGRTTTGDNGHGHQPKATPKPAPPRRGAKATKTSPKATGKSGQKLGTGPNAATSTPVAKSDPKPEKLNAKRALADEVIAALGELAKGKSDEDRLTISKWVHHLPADHAAWVKVLPNPGRSDWK